MTTSSQFKAHSEKQAIAILSKKKIVTCLTGIQWGKSSVGAVRMEIAMNEFTEKSDNFLVTAPTYKILQQATLPAFLARMDGKGRYNKVDSVFEMNEGGTCFFRTETDPDSVVGITNVRAIWGDEAGKYRKYFWDNIQARAAFKDCPVTLTTSIYAKNWIYTDLYKPWLEGRMPECEIIRATSTENPYFPKSEYERIKANMDPRRFAMMFGAEFGQMEGLVYDCWDEDSNICEPFQLPIGTRYYAGIDWGYNPDPFVCVVRAITPDGNHYQVAEFYKTGMTITDMVAQCKMLKQVFGIQIFWCDPSQPGYIEEFSRNGLGAMPADNDINRGVGLHYELIKTRKYKVFRNSSPYTLDEIETYHYPEPDDLGPDEDSKEQKPVGQNDHCLDANRYVTMHTYRSGLKQTPFVPHESETKTESQSKRIERLKKFRRSNSEAWG